MTPEGRVVAAIKKEVKYLGGQVRKCQWVAHNGAPDLFVMLGNLHFWIEAKADGGHLSEAQKREIARMEKAGCTVYVLYGEEEAVSIIREIDIGLRLS